MDFNLYNEILSKELEKIGLEHEYAEGRHHGLRGLKEHRIIARSRFLLFIERRNEVARIISESANFPEEVEISGKVYDTTFLERRGINIEIRDRDYIEPLESIVGVLSARIGENVNLSLSLIQRRGGLVF